MGSVRDLVQRISYAWDQGRDLHRRIIHIAGNVFVCWDTKRLCACQTPKRREQKTHLASADDEGPNDGPCEKTLVTGLHQYKFKRPFPKTHSAQETIRGVNARQHARPNECRRPLPNPALLTSPSAKTKGRHKTRTQLSALIADVHPIRLSV